MDRTENKTKGKSKVMGDRGNIAVLQSDGDQVWLYSHWGGTELPERLQAGLAAGKGRWSDESYLTKIIFGHAVPADNWQEETGYGISCRMQDNEHPIKCGGHSGPEGFHHARLGLERRESAGRVQAQVVNVILGLRY